MNFEYQYIMVNSPVSYQKTTEELFFNSTGAKSPSSGLDKSCKWKLYLDLLSHMKRKVQYCCIYFCLTHEDKQKEIKLMF